MHTKDIFLIGAGGHAKVVLDTILTNGIPPARIHVSDDNTALHGKVLLGLRIDVPVVQSIIESDYFHVAIGDGRRRQELYFKMFKLGGVPLSVVHPTAVISKSAAVEPGSFIAANAIVGPAAKLGRAVIINHGAVADHDCVVGEFAHIAPNATLGGGVHIGARTLIGAGANILPNVRIGDDAVIGAGAVVLSDVDAGEIHVGVPAVNLPRSKCD